MIQSDDFISIKNATVNNLKHIDIRIPRNKFIVITGLSGSGKSSLAFDTLYAEGQRRYVESLSSYARQFLGRMHKPEVDFIKGIPPAIAIQQKVNTHNPRSTVGSSTEIYDYLKLLFARIGKTYSPISGVLVKKHETSDVLNFLESQEEGTRFELLSPLHIPSDRNINEHLRVLLQQGYTRVEVNDTVERIEDLIQNNTSIQSSDKLLLVIDRSSIIKSKEWINRISDSIETAFFEGDNTLVIKTFDKNKTPESKLFSKKFEADGIQFEEVTENLFSFNNPIGACPVCEGFGKVMGIDPDAVIPNKSLSVYEDAIMCWRGEKMSEWKDELIRAADKSGIPIHRPFYELTPEQIKLIWTGNRYFHGLNVFFQWVEKNQYKIQYRVMLSRYRGKTTCPECGGTRLRKEAHYVKVNGKTISELSELPIEKLLEFFKTIKLSEYDKKVSERLITEITNRAQFMIEVGLGYLTLSRLSNTLSGGEIQRINLATSLGRNLVGSLYILDEPSVGLHSRDTNQLIGVLTHLRDLGNTVIVVEHDEEIMRAADEIIDIGPLAGRLGGELVYQGPIPDKKDISEDCKSYTLKYLCGLKSIEVPKFRRPWNNYIELLNVRENNLKGVSVKFPLNILTVVTGVSGSGKSSLVKGVFYPALKKHYEGIADRTGLFDTIKGSLNLVSDIELVDQNPIGKSSRSNPATYIKAYDEIRKLYADQPLSKQMGFTAGFFSFNTEGGRCEECQGEGTISVNMQFMSDIVLPCEACHGKEFKQDVLDVTFHEQSIYDVLEMTVNQAIEFFTEHNEGNSKQIVKRLKPLQDVGLGYIKLGQSSSTLSGGENQRVKLASFLSNEKIKPTIFVFDEPTTGLHFHDIHILMKSFNRLIDQGHTVIIIEHNLDIIKSADYIIDLGPEGGERGGEIIFSGTPEELVKCENSYTAKALKDKI